MTRTLRLLLALVAATLTLTAARAQTDALLTQYFEVPSYYNPAATGTTDMLRIRGASRLQWVGIDNAPRTFLALAESPFNLAGKRLGAGLWVRQERLGLYDDLSLALQVSYKIRLAGGTLSIGVQPGVITEKFRGSEVFIPDDDNYHEETDEAIPRSDMSGTAFDLGAGVHYTRRGFYAALSCTHLTQPTVSFSSETSSSTEAVSVFEFTAGRTFYFMAGSNIPIKNTLFEVMPSMLLASDFTFTTVQATLRMRVKSLFSFGVAYRHNDAVSLLLGAEYRQFFLGYSFDYPTTEIARASHGSHEIVAGYSLRLDLSGQNRFKQKSIRIL